VSAQLIEAATDTGAMTRMRILRRGGRTVDTRRRILSVRSRIVVAILAVAALGLAASGAASYVVQRKEILAAVDAKLLDAVPKLKTIAAGKTSAKRACRRDVRSRRFFVPLPAASATATCSCPENDEPGHHEPDGRHRTKHDCVMRGHALNGFCRRAVATGGLLAACVVRSAYVVSAGLCAR